MEEYQDSADAYKEWIGNAVKMIAVDWQLYIDAVDKGTEFSPMQVAIYGVVVGCKEGSISVASQVYEDGRMRCVQCLPVSCILEVEGLP